jgi:hypothetical protein
MDEHRQQFPQYVGMGAGESLSHQLWPIDIVGSGHRVLPLLECFDGSLEESRDDHLLSGYDTPGLTSRPGSYTTLLDATETSGRTFEQPPGDQFAAAHYPRD